MSASSAPVSFSALPAAQTNVLHTGVLVFPKNFIHEHLSDELSSTDSMPTTHEFDATPLTNEFEPVAFKSNTSPTLSQEGFRTSSPTSQEVPVVCSSPHQQRGIEHADASGFSTPDRRMDFNSSSSSMSFYPMTPPPEDKPMSLMSAPPTTPPQSEGAVDVLTLSQDGELSYPFTTPPQTKRPVNILTPPQDEVEERLRKMKQRYPDKYFELFENMYHVYEETSNCRNKDSVRAFHSFLICKKISTTQLRQFLREHGPKELYHYLILVFPKNFIHGRLSDELSSTDSMPTTHDFDATPPTNEFEPVTFKSTASPTLSQEGFRTPSPTSQDVPVVCSSPHQHRGIEHADAFGFSTPDDRMDFNSSGSSMSFYPMTSPPEDEPMSLMSAPPTTPPQSEGAVDVLTLSQDGELSYPFTTPPQTKRPVNVLTPPQDEVEERLRKMKQRYPDKYFELVENMYHAYEESSNCRDKDSVRAFHSFLICKKISTTQLRQFLREHGPKELYHYLSESTLGCDEEMDVGYFW